MLYEQFIDLLLGFAAKAGFLSGFPGIESVPGPKLPEIEFLNRFNGLIFASFYFMILNSVTLWLNPFKLNLIFFS